MIKSSKSGFTLAEVLTTLMVIGVVAAMTIPTLMNSTQEQTARTAAKKAMSVLSQSVQLIAASDTECTLGAGAGGVATGTELAGCMAQVMAGTRNGDTLTTNDGMQYKFLVPSDATGSNIASVCGDNFAGYNGAGNCMVVVDVMAGKGDDMPAANGNYTRANGYTDSANAPLESDVDIVAFTFSQQGARPYGADGLPNRGFKYLYGSKQNFEDVGLYCKKNDVACDADAANAYSPIGMATAPDANDPTYNNVAIDAGKKCCPAE